VLKITWAEYDKMIQVLDEKIQAVFMPEVWPIHLIGIPRGGLLVALHLTYLNDRYVILDSNECLFAYPIVRAGSSVLVDDFLETGKTFIEWKTRLRTLTVSPQTAVLIDKSPCYYGHTPADVSVRTMDVKEWVLLPWEQEEAEKIEASKAYKENENG
jgi:hypoxanthine phosphoribosyltransferase